MQMKYELVHDEANKPKQYPMTDMKVGAWAVIVKAKNEQHVFDALLFGCAVARLRENIYRVFTNTGQFDIDVTNYTVRDFRIGECLKIRRA